MDISRGWQWNGNPRKLVADMLVSCFLRKIGVKMVAWVVGCGVYVDGNLVV